MLNRKVWKWSNETCRHEDMGRVTEHVGRSVYVATETVRVMSDVWEDELFLYSIKDDGTLSRDGLTGYSDNLEDRPNWTIDATAEAFELYRARQEEDQYTKLVQNTNAEYADPSFKGRVVKVVAGRDKSVIGKVGKVVVVMQRPYGMGYRSSLRNKLGIALSPRMVDKVMPNGKVFKNHADMIWVWAHNCEVENPQTADLAKCREMAQSFAASRVKALRETQANAAKWCESYMRGYEQAA